MVLQGANKHCLPRRTTMDNIKLIKVVLEFAEQLIEDDRETASFAEVEQLAVDLGYSVPTPVIKELRKYGIGIETREVPKEVRGFKSNNHNLWSSPSMKSHGGSGGASIQGFASEPMPFGKDAINGDSAQGSRDKVDPQDRAKAYPYSRSR
jgi:hypothetical protein